MCPHQSFWALFFDWFCVQGPARCHHFHQPPASQVKIKKQKRCLFATLLLKLPTTKHIQQFLFILIYLYFVLNLHHVAVFFKCKVYLVNIFEYAAVDFLYALVADSLSLLSVMTNHSFPVFCNVCI